MRAITTTIGKRVIDQINSCHSRIEGMGMPLLEEAINAGHLISKVKADLPHGTFMEWVKENLKFSHKTATNYVRLHELELAGKLETVANIGEAYKLITSPPKIATSSPAPSKPALPLGATYQDAEIVEPTASPAPITPEPQHDDVEPLVVDGTITDENPWDTSRQAIAELAKLDDKISSPLSDVLAYIEKRWNLTFNRRDAQ